MMSEHDVPLSQYVLLRKGYQQCDQIWRFIGLWETF